ncbi:TIGR02569 family protein, partial [Saccharomonospora iraqiensis]|uniref:TIGR02569 family protein n=1 Tax=Saccharomonospora iraqiensis TaxID=52698 RepID=UPI00059454AA
DAEPMPDGRGWRCGGVVLEPVRDRAHAVWVSRTMAALDSAVEHTELRIARPVVAGDGRWVIGGWRARRHLAGSAGVDAECGVLTAVRLHQTTATLPHPDPLPRPDTTLPRPDTTLPRPDPLPRPDFPGAGDATATLAERLAWGEAHRSLDEERGGRLFEILAPSRRPTSSPDQLVHGDLFGMLCSDGDSSVPGLVDFTPHVRPAEWGTALVAVDALVHGAADGTLLRHWSHLPEWPQMLLRALLYRLAGHALTPHSPETTLDALRRTATEITDLL